MTTLRVTRRSLGGRGFGFRIRLEDLVADPVLGRGVFDGAQERERAAFAIDAVLPGGEGDVAPVAGATLPDGEANQLQALERAVAEVEFDVSEFARRIAVVIRDDFHF